MGRLFGSPFMILILLFVLVIVVVAVALVVLLFKFLLKQTRQPQPGPPSGGWPQEDAPSSRGGCPHGDKQGQQPDHRP